MATQYDPNTNTTYTTATPPAEKRKPYAWIAVGIVLLALIAVFALPDGRSGTDPTAGTPPASMDTVPPAATEPAPAPPPAAPY